MAISRKLIGILAVSSIGLIALSASAQNANDDASRKTKPKNTNFVEGGAIQHTDDWRERSSKGYTTGRTWVSGDPVDLNLRKKGSGGNASVKNKVDDRTEEVQFQYHREKSGSNAQEKVQYQDFDFSQHSRQSAPSTLPAGSNEWQPPKPVIGDILQGTDIRSNGIGVDQKLGQPDYRTVKARPKANSKSRRRN